MRLYADSWAVANALAEGHVLERNMTVKLVLGDMWLDPSEWAKT